MKTGAVNHAAVVAFRSLPKYTIRNDTKESSCFQQIGPLPISRVTGRVSRVYIVFDSSREDAVYKRLLADERNSGQIAAVVLLLRASESS